mgnify:CR=1 FL=1
MGKTGSTMEWFDGNRSPKIARTTHHLVQETKEDLEEQRMIPHQAHQMHQPRRPSKVGIFAYRQ